MRNKIFLTFACVLCSLGVFASSAFFTAQAYFTDKSTGYTCIYRLPDTSYQVAAFYADGTYIHTFFNEANIDYNTANNKKENVDYIVKLKNTGNVTMKYNYHCVAGSYEDSGYLTVEPGKEEILNLTGTINLSEFNSDDSELISIKITPTSIIDDDASYTINGHTKNLSLYYEQVQSQKGE